MPIFNEGSTPYKFGIKSPKKQKSSGTFGMKEFENPNKTVSKGLGLSHPKPSQKDTQRYGRKQGAY